MKAVKAVVLLLSAGGPAFGLWVQQEFDVPAYNASTSSWRMEGKALPEQGVRFTVALRVEEDNRAALETIFWAVSDPDSPSYGRHLSVDDITEVLAVPAERVEAVSSYFRMLGAEVELSPNRDMMEVITTVQVAEAALQTQLYNFRHQDFPDAQILRAAGHYYLPLELSDHVALVGDLLQFPRLRDGASNSNGVGAWPNDCSTGACKGLVTPGVLATRYKIPTTDGSANNSMAVAEFQGQHYQPKDLEKFGSSCHRDVEVARDVGKNTPSAGVESELDIEYIKAVAPEIPLTVVYNSEYSLLSWANQIVSLKDSPLVHSVSYGNDEVQQSGKAYMETCNTAFMKAGARGLSILFASGDQGVCGRSGCGLFTHARFHPDFPAASPYITAVGGTNFLGSDIGDEEAWASSGGGFSDTFPIPDYQKEAVAGYKASKDAELPPQSLWNNTGRGYPDVSALGGTKTPYCVATGGSFAGVAGTSASCPVVAGVFAKLNGLRLAQGQAPLGFLNPLIYKNPGAFQDVTAGKNSDTRKYGFKAVKGWDAATGFGTPDFEALSKVVAALPAVSTVVV